MKDIYIVLTHTGTILSSIIKYYTKEKYSHVSIGLDGDLKELYSFGRLNPYNPFRAGFIHEEINEGTFRRFRNTLGSVYSYRITDKQYEDIVYIINRMKQNKNIYKFNIIGLFLVSLNKKYKRNNSFYCAEFVKYLLETSLNRNVVPEIVKPTDFIDLDDIELIYEGLFKKYSNKHEIMQNKYDFGDGFNTNNSTVEYAK